MDNLLEILIINFNNYYLKTFLKLDIVSNTYHNILCKLVQNIIINKVNINNIKYRILFFYYINYCNSIDFLKKCNTNDIYINKKIKYRIKYLQIYNKSIYNIIETLYNHYYNTNNIYIVYNIGCSSKRINKNLINILSKHVNINCLLSLKYYFIFCKITDSIKIYNIKHNSKNNIVKQLADKYLYKRKKIGTYLLTHYGIVL